jgi:hypothetical protein
VGKPCDVTEKTVRHHWVAVSLKWLTMGFALATMVSFTAHDGYWLEFLAIGAAVAASWGLASWRERAWLK